MLPLLVASIVAATECIGDVTATTEASGLPPYGTFFCNLIYHICLVLCFLLFFRLKLVKPEINEMIFTKKAGCKSIQFKELFHKKVVWKYQNLRSH